VVRVLIAEDDSTSREILEILLEDWGYEVVVCCDGTEAWNRLQRDDAPPLAILDWMLPGIDGPEICRRVRRLRDDSLPYILFLTARSHKSDMVEALQAGGDDFLVKPFDQEELQARLQVGTRVIRLQQRVLDQERAARAQAEKLADRRSRQLSSANEQLEERQQQLIRSEKLAALGQLAAGVAHELNNPIGYVRSNLDVMYDYTRSLDKYIRLYRALETQVGKAGISAPGGDLIEGLNALRSEEDIDYLMRDLSALLQESREGADRLMHIVQALKNLGRADDDEMRPTDLNAEIETALRVSWNELKYRAEVHRDLRPLPLVTCFPIQMNQVLTNLLVNAAQSLGEFGTVTVRSRVEGDYAVLSIADTGDGIPPEILPHIFDAFYTTKKVGEGTGLGLSISKAIIETHKGRIEVDSQKGQGTVFTIHLPLEPPPTLADPS
jgi:two-component system, NtrC family, sensor kinase